MIHPLYTPVISYLTPYMPQFFDQNRNTFDDSFVMENLIISQNCSSVMEYVQDLCTLKAEPSLFLSVIF